MMFLLKRGDTLDLLTLKIITGIVFVITYSMIVKFYQKKAWIIWGGVFVMILLGATTWVSGFHAINWNVIGIYVGMLFVVESMIMCHVPEKIAVWVAERAKKAWMVMILLCLITSLLSIVLENVACILIIAPIVFSISKKMEVSPVPTLIGCAVSSNLQGAATLIGDPPSMLLAGYAGLNFNDFFVFQGKPGMFFAVQLGMIASLFVLYFFFRKYEGSAKQFNKVRVTSWFPLVILGLMVVTLALASMRTELPSYSMGVICLFFGLMCLAWMIGYTSKKNKNVWNRIERMDWATALFLIAVFVLIDALVSTNVIGTIATGIYGLTGSSLFATFVTIVMLSVVLSAFVDNVPYLVALLPVIPIIAAQIGASPYVLFFGLLIGASVGGNITPVGASANIVGMGMLRQKHYVISFWQFMKIGLPFTIVATVVSAGFIWLMYGL